MRHLRDRDERIVYTKFFLHIGLPRTLNIPNIEFALYHIQIITLLSLAPFFGPYPSPPPPGTALRWAETPPSPTLSAGLWFSRAPRPPPTKWLCAHRARRHAIQVRCRPAHVVFKPLYFMNISTYIWLQRVSPYNSYGWVFFGVSVRSAR